ncbi:hypothetical protein UFOVP45_62 [uncultured Caudovirales phage]|uniref:Uncharacterized protein n=1 Tax=uncultured Caudovirales phage TaxID=2100421 RepID=A0A6J5KRU3_9CAUD|nr:hypothetical protein UFOVP45_62 [uncultured Caudovirales phage]
MIDAPSVNASDYLDAEDEDVAPKHGTTVQAGWGDADKFLKPKSNGDYPTDFRFSDQQQLVRFLEDAPFRIYEQHWIEREGKKSFVCLSDDEGGCPLCTIAGDKARAKFAFNVLVLSDEEQTVQILTAPPTLARQLRAANDDPRRGPLTKFYWAISRQGSGPQTTYTLDRVRATDLAEEWELDPTKVEATASASVSYGPEAIYTNPREELLTVARSLVAN